MYLTKVHLKNIRSFEDVMLELEPKAGWNVILGDNGAGKSTLIKSIALALVGDPEMQGLGFKMRWKDWLRYNSDNGTISLSFDNGSKKEVTFSRNKGNGARVKETVELPDAPFSASYGVFRRLGGGSDDYDVTWENNHDLAPHLSALRSDVALDKSIEWLDECYEQWADLYYKAEEELTAQEEHHLFWKVATFINNSKLLLDHYDLEEVAEKPPHTSTRLNYCFTQNIEGANCQLNITDLSDGYTSVLGLVIELLRQLVHFHAGDTSKVFDEKDEPIKVISSGVVLIDEVASHLHPSWQARIGEWFTEYFPNIQFIVTTHSPIICRSATEGSIQKIVHEEGKTKIEPIPEDKRQALLYGNILDAYETNLFGRNITQSPEGLKKLERLATLKVRKQYGQELSPEEQQELTELLEILSSNVIDPFK